MMLIIDMGNTRTKWGYLTGQGYIYGGEMLNRQLNAAAAPFSEKKPTAIYIAAVAATEITQGFVSLCKAVWNLEPVLLQSQVECCGVRNGYDEPSRLGVDRWAALVAAYRLVQGAVVVIDCGTAMTVDVVDQDGCHLGGWIVPGMNLMTQSLVKGTALVRYDGGAAQSEIMGRDTTSCLLRGAEAAHLGVIGRVQQEMTARLGNVTIVITGGDAPVLLPNIPFGVCYEPDLVLQGISAIVESTGVSV